jgi:23S rRNA pseudouridine2605 synthase
VMLNKPARTLSTSRDEPGAGRRTVVGLVNHPAAPRLFPVGRLDFQTTGLVLLTNDGDLANRLTHPRYGVARTYHATIKGAISDETLAATERGIRRFEHKSAKARPGAPAPRVELSVVGRDASSTILAATLVRGPVQELSRLLRSLGCSVKSLERVALGPLVLKGVGRGQWRELERHEIGELRRAARAAAPRAAGAAGQGAGA